MIIRKFGGSSMIQLDSVANILDREAQQGDVTVVSAFKGVTDLLIQCAKRAYYSVDYSKQLEEIRNIHQGIIDSNKLDYSCIQEQITELEQILNTEFKTERQENQEDDIEDIKNLQYIDHQFAAIVQSFGERLSSRVLAAKLTQMDHTSQAFDAFDIGMITDSNYLNSSPTNKATKEIKQGSLSNYQGLAIVTGFIGKDTEGNITLLGSRGGSDFSATYFGAALEAEKTEIWTDTLFRTADPRIIENTKVIRLLSYREAGQLAYYGAKILHPDSIGPAERTGMPIVIRDTTDSEDQGTLITQEGEVHDEIVKSITSKPVYLVRTESVEHAYESGFAEYVFGAFRRHGISVDMIATSNTEIACSVDIKNGNKTALDEAVKEINQEYGEKSAYIEKGTQINVVGEGMKDRPGVSAKILCAITSKGINDEIVSKGGEINFGFVVQEQHGNNAVKAIHEEYFC